MTLENPKNVVEAAAGGDTEAFRKIYDGFLEDVKGVVAKYISGEAQIKDVVQKAFVEIHDSLDSVSDYDKFGSWLCQIARNTAISHYRKHSTSVDFVPLENLQSPMDEWSKLEARQKVRALYAAMDTLPDKKREALIMYEIEGLKLKEIAEQTDTSINTIGSRVRRGRKQLASKIRDILDSSGDVDEEVYR